MSASVFAIKVSNLVENDVVSSPRRRRSRKKSSSRRSDKSCSGLNWNLSSRMESSCRTPRGLRKSDGSRSRKHSKAGPERFEISLGPARICFPSSRPLKYRSALFRYLCTDLTYRQRTELLWSRRSCSPWSCRATLTCVASLRPGSKVQPLS